MGLAHFANNDRLRGWAQLVALQAVVCIVLFHDYLSGEKYFAFADVASDTYHQFVPVLMHMAKPSNWASAWTFNVGLGAIAPFYPNPFTLLGIAGGPDGVLGLRIWVYLAKIFTGGAAFYGFGLAISSRREIALIAGLAYSFCGFVMTDGQWDAHSAEFVAYAVILWAFARQAKDGNRWLIPLSIALAGYTTFIFSTGVFVGYLFAASLIASDRPGQTARNWLRSVVPQCAIGLLLAAPAILPLIFGLLDSPRVAGPHSAFTDRLGEVITFNDWTTIQIELAGFFHKNLLGVGNGHFGWMNYLESPGFHVGILALMLIPQLSQGSRSDRRILAAGAVLLALFVALPAIRYATFGFGLDYFRVNNLMVTVLLLSLFARALEVVADRGIRRGLLVATFVALFLVVAYVHSELMPRPSIAHEGRIAAFACVSLLLGLFAGRSIQWKQFATLSLVVVAAEGVVLNYPSFHGNRIVVNKGTVGYDDGTKAALAFIKARDSGFYRVEKTYNSVSFCDALAQGYMGVKSYWFQSSGITAFYSDLDLIPKRSRIKNFTNWLPNFDGRFPLYSLTGVKYMIVNQPLEWIGFRKLHEVGSLTILENDLALPLGVVYERQFPVDQFRKMSKEAKDIIMINAVIVDHVRGDAPSMLDTAQMMRQSTTWMEENYVAPAQLLKRRGMVIEKFSPGSILGIVESPVPGILAFSIPFSKGWSISIDGAEQPLFSANLGMLAADIPKGRHRIELTYALPGLAPGLALALIGLIVLVVGGLRTTLRPRAALSQEAA